MEQVFHHYDTWEEHRFGMWKTMHGTRKEIMLKRAIRFTGNAEDYGFNMMRVVKEWTYSCEVNLTNDSINKRAWVGHAAACIALGCPEHITREAWHFLSEEQQVRANHKADLAIKYWMENRKCQNKSSGLQFLLPLG